MRRPIALLALCAFSFNSLIHAQSQTLQKEIEQAKTLWKEVKVFESISAWKRVLKIDPLNKEAQSFLEKVGPILEGSDSFMDLLEDFITQDLLSEAKQSLKKWKAPVLSREQQARLYYLKGKLSLKRKKRDDALFYLQSAKKMLGDKALLSRVQLELGLLQISMGRRLIGLRLIDEAKQLSKDPQEIAHIEWTMVENQLNQDAIKPAIIREYIAKYPNYRHIALAYMKLAKVSETWAGKSTQDSLFALLDAWDQTNHLRLKDRIVKKISDDIDALYDREPLKQLSQRLLKSKENWEVTIPLQVLRYECFRRLSILDPGEEATKLALEAESILATLLKQRPKDYRQGLWFKQKAVAGFTAGQLELIHGNDITALQIFVRIADEFKHLAKKGDSEASDILKRIATIMKTRGRPEAAKQFLEDLSLSFLGDDLGKEALWSLAELYKNRLDRPLKYIRTLKRYQDVYPPNFRIPSSAQDRIRKLGYRDVSSFQAAHGLQPDGIIGKKTYSVLYEEERIFKEIFPEEKDVEQTRGRMIHNSVFRTAEELRSKSRFREAIQAYMEFNRMYPGYHLGDESMIGIARIFKQCDLFEEAIVTYERIIDDYPKGDKTRFAYMEVAECYIGLGKWSKARDTYQRFIQNFPRYKQTPLAKKNHAALNKIIKYAEFLKEKPDASKSSNASYELAKIVYKELNDIRKAAKLFSDIADTYSKSYHGPDAAYTAGVCYLHENDFDKAREAFSKVIKNHKESRLADDAQYWIGHTHEYRARALGKLDYQRIVLRSRSAREISELQNDLKLRSLFYEEAKLDPNHGKTVEDKEGEMAHIRDQVRSDLQKAIGAYRKVVSDFRRGDMAQKALLSVGQIYSQYLNDHDKAIEVYRELLHKYPGSHAAVDAQYEVGYHYLKKKNYVEAEKAIELFLTSFPNHKKVMDALLDLAECHRQQKKWIKALDDYQTYLNKFPRSKKSAFVKAEIDWIKKYRF